MSIENKLQPTGQIEQYEPEPLIDEIEKPTHYPAEALPKIMRDAVIGIADFVQLPVALAGQSILGAAAYLAQTRVDAWSPVARSNQMPCSLYMLALGDSGDRKSSAHNLAFAPIQDAEDHRKDAYESERDAVEKGREGLTGKALSDYTKSNPLPFDPATIISSDGSYSRIASMLIEGTPSLFWNSDEGAQMLGGHSMKGDDRTAVLGGLTKWWDNGRGERLRSRGNADGSGTATNRRLSINLLAQEIAVRAELSDPILRGQGFLPRFLFSAPASVKGTRFLTMERLNSTADDDLRIVSYWNRLQHLMSTPMALNPDNQSQVRAPVLKLTRDATRLWMSFYDATEAAMKRFGEYAELAPFAARSGEIALRVATVLAYFNLQDHVDAEVMRGAIALTDHSLMEWKRYACVAQVDKKTQLAIQTIDWLISKVKSGDMDWLEFSGRDWARKGYSPIRSARQRDSAFAVLLEKKHLLTDGSSYRINPTLLNNIATTASTATGQISKDILVATHMRQTATQKKESTNVAMCRNDVATINLEESKGVANVANVATVQQCKIII